MIEPGTQVRLTSNHIESMLDGEVIILNVQSGQYYGLEGISRDIWNLLQSPTCVNTICQSIVQEYEVTPEQCQDDVTAFLDTLIDEGLLVTV